MIGIRGKRHARRGWLVAVLVVTIGAANCTAALASPSESATPARLSAPRSQPIGHANQWFNVGKDRWLFLYWTPDEHDRLEEIAAFMGLSPLEAQKAVVYATAYILGFADRTPTPVKVPPTGTARGYTVVWQPAEIPILDTVCAKFVLSPDSATRVSLYLVSYLLALGGH